MELSELLSELETEKIPREENHLTRQVRLAKAIHVKEVANAVDDTMRTSPERAQEMMKLVEDGDMRGAAMLVVKSIAGAMHYLTMSSNRKLLALLKEAGSVEALIEAVGSDIGDIPSLELDDDEVESFVAKMNASPAVVYMDPDLLVDAVAKLIYNELPGN